MKKPRRLFSVFAGCFTFFLIGTAFAVRADEKDDLEKQRSDELKRVEAMLKAQINALIEKEKADPNDAKSLFELGVRCSNEFYLADSCAIAAVRAGADEIKTAPFGNFTVSLERFVKILNVKADVCGVCCDVRATELHHGVEQIKRLCQTNRSKPTSFSNLSPADHADIQLTSHDSKETVIEAVKSLNFELTDEDAQNVYDAFLKVAESNEVVGSKELDAIVATVAFQVPPTYKLGSYVINSGNQISATCHITLKKGDQVLDSVCVGDGPIDAAFQAIDKVIGHHYELDDFQIQSVTEGREAMGETVVRLRSEGKIYSGRGISTDIVGSSIAAYINAVNKIAFEEA